MRSLIPKVKVGYVLRGTRNLRHWLQTASTLRYLMYVSSRSSITAGEVSDMLYRGQKEDSFLVTVSTNDKLGVYGERGNVALLFVAQEYTPEKIRTMSPEIFSKWFIKTGERNPDLTTWPYVAAYMRASLHLNLVAIRGEKSLSYPYTNDMFGLFDIQNRIPKQPPALFDNMLNAWAPRGIGRNVASKRSKKNITNYRNPKTYGPSLNQLQSMREEIEELCKDPRVRKKLGLSSQKHEETLYI